MIAGVRVLPVKDSDFVDHKWETRGKCQTSQYVLSTEKNQTNLWKSQFLYYTIRYGTEHNEQLLLRFIGRF